VTVYNAVSYAMYGHNRWIQCPLNEHTRILFHLSSVSCLV